jgi:hypothetical protein
LGALRRPQLEPEERELLRGAESEPAATNSSYPRWIVITGVVLYCSVFWTIIWIAGSTGIEWVRAAAATAH